MLSLRAELGAEIRSAKGELIQQIPFEECHSFVKQFAQILYGMLGQIGLYIKDTAGASNATTAGNMVMKANTPAPWTTWGMVIGNGVAAVTMLDYKLASLLTTNISYGAMGFAIENPEAATWRAVLSRGFLNNTGAVVDVKEVGLYIRDGASKNVCIDRTLYTVAFNNSETLTLTYRISITL